MKFLAIIVCFYVNVLTVLPTVKAVKMTFEKKCHDTCCGNKTNGDSPNDCQKENCFLNINFNNVTFLVFDTDYQLQTVFFLPPTKENTHYKNSLVADYSVTIWQPPESVLFA